MVSVPVQCPYCQNTEVIKAGKQANGAQRYQCHLPPEQHTVGKLSMQKIERKHLTLRTRLKRLARKTLCLSRSRVMHDLLIGLYMNRVEFGCPV
jgi:insertion element IS1 protein InsB